MRLLQKTLGICPLYIALSFLFGAYAKSTKKYEFLYPGKMPGLEHSFEDKSFWIPNECAAFEKNSFDSFKGKQTKIVRPSGWIPGSLKIGKILIDEAVKSIFSNTDHNYHAFESVESCLELLDFRREILPKIEIHKLKDDVKFVLHKKSRGDCTNLTSLKKHVFGSCAIVASGSNLLKTERGTQIDSLDTVIRVGHMPIRGWENIVGSRTDILIGRGTIQAQYAQNYASLKYIIGSDWSESASKMNIARLKLIDSINFFPNSSVIDKMKLNLGSPLLAPTLYRVMTSPIGKKKRGASTGFIHSLRIIFSRLCSKVHIFGMSSECGGYYHNQAKRMKLHHSCELESWSFHYLMRNHHKSAHTCIWN